MWTTEGSSPALDDCRIVPICWIWHCKLTLTYRAAIHHPDKVSTSGDDTPSDAIFVQLKTAQDTLLNPSRRFAYDRFGPDVLHWQHCSSIGDYVQVGIKAAAPIYLGSSTFMIILGVTGYLQWGRFVSHTHTSSQGDCDFESFRILTLTCFGLHSGAT